MQENPAEDPYFTEYRGLLWQSRGKSKKYIGRRKIR